jgi:hypothetical protein
MKWIGFVVLATLMTVGCTPDPFLQPDPPPQSKKVEKPPPPPPRPAPPIIQPDSVTEQNAEQSAKALRDELEYEMPPSKAPAQPK